MGFCPQKYAKVVGKNLDSTDMPKPSSAEDPLTEIDRQQSKFSDFQEKRHILFTVLGGALKPVELVGNLASGAASMAFPPSSMVFGAVAYLIHAGHGVSSNYDSIVELFQEIRAFTTRWTVHTRQNNSKELRDIVTKILSTLIKICGMSSKLISHGRMGQFLRGVVLGKDETVAAEMANLRRLTEDEEKLVGALTLAGVNQLGVQMGYATNMIGDTQSGVHEVIDKLAVLTVKVDDMKKESSEDAERKQLEKIRLMLRPNFNAEELFNNISAKRVDKTGDWIHNEPLFQGWLEGLQSLFWLSGGPGAGKSFLSSNIIEYLVKLHPQNVQNQSRVTVAYFFFKDNDPDLRSFDTALRTMAYQMSQSDPVFAKYVARFSPEQLISAEMIWRKLFVHFFQEANLSNKVYIMLDGLKEALEEQRQKFLELLDVFQEDDKEKLRIEIVMVGRPELNYEIDQVLKNLILMITVSVVKDIDDINQYVKVSMAKIKILRKVSQRLRDSIVETLTTGADSMFLWVDLMLKEIATKHKEPQIRDALKSPPKGLTDTLRHVLERFSIELRQEDIDDLNQLLSWVTCVKRPLKLGELDDAIKSTSEDGSGLLYVEGELRKRYASFFTVTREDGMMTEALQVQLTRDEDGDKMEEHQNTGTDNDFGEEMDIVSDPFTTEITLAHASISDFSKRETKTAPVGVDINDASVMIVKALLDIICNDEKFTAFGGKSFGKYAAAQWQFHLVDINLSKTSCEDRGTIGKQLMKMLRQQNIMFRWGAENNIRYTFVYHPDSFEVIHKWLADQDVSSDFTDEEKLWIQSLHPTTDVEILDPSAAYFVEEWLTKSRWLAENIYRNLKAYSSLKRSRKGEGESPKADTKLTDEKAEDIYSVAREYKFEEDALWQCKVGRVLRKAGHLKEAREACEKAQKLDPNLWLPYVGIAHVCEREESIKEAIIQLEKVIKMFEENPKLMEDNKPKYASYVRELGRLYNDEGVEEKALPAYYQRFKLFPQDYEVASWIIRTLTEQKKYLEAMDFLKEMHSSIEATGNSRLVEWCIMYTYADADANGVVGVDDFLKGVNTCVRECKEMKFLRDVYELAIEAARKASKSGQLANLQYDLGEILKEDLYEEEKAVKLWADIVDLAAAPKAGTDMFTARNYAARELSQIYFDRALEAGKGSDDAEVYIAKMKHLLGFQTSDVLDEDELFYSTRETGLLIGLLDRLFGNIEEAKEHFKVHIKLGLDLLSDDDPQNDWQGYTKLAIAAKFAGDDTLWQTAMELLDAEEEDDDEESSDEDSTTDDSDGDDKSSAIEKNENQDGEEAGEAAASQANLKRDKVYGDVQPNPSPLQSTLTSADEGQDGGSESASEEGSDSDGSDSSDDDDDDGGWKCYGMCRRGVPAAEINFCRHCLDCELCDDCLKLLKSDELPINICNVKHHEYLKMKANEDRLPKGRARVDGKLVPLSEWLDGIRKTWGI